MTAPPPTTPPAPNTAEAIRSVAIASLIEQPVGGYADGGPDAAEPTAWATIALASVGERESAARGAAWLAELQTDDGRVGVTVDDLDPGWPTSLAMLAWDAVDSERFADRIGRGADWALGQAPWVQPKNRVCGHDSTLEGWSWAPNTHSWLEPTAFFVLALRRAGLGDHARVRQGVELLVDRLLPDGGANYGNTTVLGQVLLQHLQPSGIAALALAAEGLEEPRFDKTLDYLERALNEPTGATSFAFGVLGLTANGRSAGSADEALARAWRSAAACGGSYKPALVALAADAILSPNNAGPFAVGDQR